ncbi:MAG TPA: carboxylesterase family protein [Allosphingosinicella sp.]|nr:carboxylesterase family protein [Allosphingosinicella sp.]
MLRGAEPEIVTSLGAIRGTSEGGVRVFRGLRYGAASRFQAPAAPPPIGDVLAADRFGPSSPQRGDRYPPTSEDCLYLNIWTPEASPARRRPVMVYIHGGAYSTGSAVDPLLDGGRLALNDVVVVTLQHRLGAFGYLYLARLDPRFPDSGNAGQLDLILALRWIRENIARFGGDPGEVTLFGQSGGGAKIATMMGMPAAAGLFHRAATMSGQQVTASGPQNATARTRAYLSALRVDSPEALRTLSTEALVEGLGATDPILGGSLYFGPVLDMKWLTRHPFWPDANPQSNRIPLLLGNTHDETRAFYPPGHPKLAGLGWENIAERIGPELRIDAHPEWVIAEYRRLFPAYSAEQVFYAATTAGRSWRAQLIEAEERARAGAPAYVYQLDHPSPAPHGADIPPVFGGTGALAEAFLRFARTGDPGWPAYTLPARRTMIFGETPHVESDPRRAERELFAPIPYVQPGT